MLKRSGFSSAPLGNYGESPLRVMDLIEAPVIELSSFQLTHFTPPLFRSVITCLSENHLDWHGSFSEYLRCKLSIARQGNFVFDFDDKISADLLCKANAFAAISIEASYKTVRDHTNAKHVLTLMGETVYLDGTEYTSIAGATRHERHNLKNYLSAIGVTLGLATADGQREAIISFSGLESRCELFLTHNGTQYYNSSIDTTPKRTLSTLRSLEKGTVIILDGKSKGGSYEDLILALPELTEGAVLMGDVGKIVSQGLKNYSTYPYFFANDFDNAIEKIHLNFPRDKNILLSPAGTSYDRYGSFKERATDFKRAVYRYTGHTKT
jgi:UDP-N-acetylmuramoylalanine--D-glutamate ligase